jgi:hypothetical protein
MAFVAPNREAGRILYQGMMDQARGIAGAVNQFVDEGYKRQEQDKEFNAKLKVTEQALGTFIKPKAAEFGTTPEAIDAFLKVDPSESPKERYLRLGGFLEQAITSSKMTRDAQQAETQRKYTDALAASAMAQKSATDAATADRLRETQQAERFIKSIKELEKFEQMEQSDTPFSIQDAERYQQLKGNDMLKRARQAGELGMDAASFLKTLQGERGLEIQDREVTNRQTIAELKAQNDQLKALIDAGQKPKFNAGEKKTFEVAENITVTGVWDGTKFLDELTGLPIVENVTYVDSSGNRITEEGGYNPAVLRRYKIPVPERGKPVNPFAKKTGETTGETTGKPETSATTTTGQPNPANLQRVSGTGTPSAPAPMGVPPRKPVNTDFLYKNSPRFNTSDEAIAAARSDPRLIGTIVIVNGVPVRIKGPE